MNSKLVFACALLLASPAMAQSMGEKSGVNSVLGVSPTTPDFVKEAAMSDMYEIASSKLALQKADQPTKEFATQKVADHTKTSTELKAATTGLPDAPVPAALDSSHQDKLASLAKLNGADFTKEYHSEQVGAHKDAVSLFERYAKSGDNLKLKSWAETTLPTLRHHLEMAQTLDK